MDDIEALCDHIIIIGGGEILCDGTLSALRSQVSSRRYLRIDLANDNFFFEQEGVSIISKEGRTVTLAFDPTKLSAASLISQVTSQHEVEDLFVENPPIEEIVAELYAISAGIIP
ncbi:hypothetical protein [Nostoc sp.]|uniref:hypothetical protein n=1 Tax=Nostoc sp. TaxID=1180 RepID=UPI002FFCF3B3